MAKKKKLDPSELLVDAIIEGMQNNKAQDIASAIQRNTRKELKEKPWHTEGKSNSEWILLDYIDVVCHIFYKDARSFYDIEDLWADAKRTDLPNL